MIVNEECKGPEHEAQVTDADKEELVRVIQLVMADLMSADCLDLVVSELL